MSFIYIINRNVGEYDVRECWAYDYTDPIIQSILFLSFGVHSPFFCHVMKNFKIERVIVFPFYSKNFQIFHLKTEISFMFLLDYLRTTSDRLGQNNFGNHLEEMSIMFKQGRRGQSVWRRGWWRKRFEKNNFDV